MPKPAKASLGDSAILYYTQIAHQAYQNYWDAHKKI